MDDLINELLAERFGALPATTPVPEREPDTVETWNRRQKVLADMPGDEWPGEEAA